MIMWRKWLNPFWYLAGMVVLFLFVIFAVSILVCWFLIESWRTNRKSLKKYFELNLSGTEFDKLLDILGV